MSGSRRVQRSVRVTVAGGLVLAAVCAVAVAVSVDAYVSAAAIAAALAAVVAARMLYSELTQSRREHARERAVLAKSFGLALSAKQAEHTAFTQAVTVRVREKDRAISELNGTIRLAEARADEAEDRVRREARRANEAQGRLSELLDEVLAQQAAVLDGVEVEGDLGDLPTIIDLLAWEDRVNEAIVDDLRKQA